jgi:hypothetical protein
VQGAERRRNPERAVADRADRMARGAIRLRERPAALRAGFIGAGWQRKRARHHSDYGYSLHLNMLQNSSGRVHPEA